MIEIKNVNFHYSGLDQAGLSDFKRGFLILICLLQTENVFFCAVHQAVVKQL